MINTSLFTHKML